MKNETRKKAAKTVSLKAFDLIVLVKIKVLRFSNYYYNLKTPLAVQTEIPDFTSFCFTIA